MEIARMPTSDAAKAKRDIADNYILKHAKNIGNSQKEEDMRPA